MRKKRPYDYTTLPGGPPDLRGADAVVREGWFRLGLWVSHLSRQVMTSDLDLPGPIENRSVEPLKVE